MKRITYLFLFLVVFLLCGGRAYAASVTITANYDGDASDSSSCSTSDTETWLEGSDARRIYMRFPLSSLPANAYVTQAQLQYTVRTAGANASSIQGFDRIGQTDPQGLSCGSRYSNTADDSSPYLADTNVTGSTGQKTITLGSSANTDITNAKAAGTSFSIGINEGTNTGSQGRIYSIETGSSANRPKLILTYTIGSTYYADFGINPNPPDCNPPSTNASSGVATSVSANPCSPLNPTPTITWGTPIVPTGAPGDTPTPTPIPGCIPPPNKYDLNGDGSVTTADSDQVAAHFGETVGSDPFLQKIDYVNDGVISILDMSAIAANVGKQTCQAAVSCGTISGTGATVNYTPPAGVCSSYACSLPFTASNSSGSSNESLSVTVQPNNTITGTVYADTLNNGCTSGATPMGATLTINNGTTPVTTSSGNYTIADNFACGSRSITVSNVGIYHVKATRFDGTSGIPGGAWDSASAGFTYSFNFASGSTSHTLDWCMTNVNPWVQTTTGNVRYTSIPYFIPVNQAASSSQTNPSVFTSTGSFPWTVGQGTVSNNSNAALASRYLVNNEYSDYNSASTGTNGGASYSFYRSRAVQRSLTTPEPPGCTSGTTCTTSFTGLSGAYHHTGDLVISGYTHTDGNHVLLLVSGKTTINSNIAVPSTCISSLCNLFILASKGDIHVASGVGQTTASSAAVNLQGVFTSEGSIYADGGLCAGGSTADRRLNIEGSLIANSRKPFAANGAGSVVNNRSLCSQDPSYPSLTVAQRLDFALQLTDFYKTSVTRWKELNP